ncbi:plexin-A2-like [Glandiceps talaboti]
MNCPDPTIGEVWPMSGPYEGETQIIINGTDMGKYVSDIEEVTVAGLPCTIVPDMYLVSRRIECKTNASTVGHTGQINVKVLGNDNSVQLGNSDKEFTYRDPNVEDFRPKIGPSAGGSIVTLTGDFIDAGRDIQAMFGDFPCLIDRMMDVVNETIVTCSTTSSSNYTGPVQLMMSFDGAKRSAPADKKFWYSENPRVEDISPTQSMASGGRTINVTGENFLAVQEPRMVVTSGLVDFTSDPCDVENDFFMLCTTPAVQTSPNSRFTRDANCTEGCTDATVSFIMDEVDEVQNLELEFVISPDPQYDKFDEEDNIRDHIGTQLAIDGRDLNLASTTDEVTVYIGKENCEVVSLSDVQLSCIPPPNKPSGVNKTGSPTINRHAAVRVEVGNLAFDIGYVRYPSGVSVPKEIIYGVAAAAGLLLIVIIILVVCFQRKSKDKDKQFSKLQGKMDKFEMDVKTECKRAFTELQTDMSDLTRDLQGTGIPFQNFNNYAVNMMFAGQTNHPVFDKEAETPTGSLARGLEEFYSLLANKDFCLVFIRTLEEQKMMTTKDKVNVGSLLTITLHRERKMMHLTDVLKVLLAEAAEEAEIQNRTKSMLRRTESIMEKLLTNWFLLSLYPFIKISAGESIFWLFKAMKHQIDKGPMDALEGLAKYSLSDKCLLRENFDPETLTIDVVTEEDGSSNAKAKVLDVDTVSQVKDKLLDVIYSNHPYSSRPSVQEIDLEWRGGTAGHGRITLQDQDVTTEPEGQWRRLNTMKHYKIPDGAKMALVPRTQPATGDLRTPITPPSDYAFAQFHNPDAAQADEEQPALSKGRDVEEGTEDKVWHLIKVKPAERKKRNLRERAMTRAKSMYRPQRVSEIYLLQLVSTKGTIQEYVDNVFDALLTLDKQQFPVFPPPIKHMFDYLDGLAEKYGDDDPDVSHIWKSNSLPLRVWANMLKSPQFLFDIRVSNTVKESLYIVAQTFIDACSKIERKLGVKSPANKLLYAKEIPIYKDKVDAYYEDIRSQPDVSDKDLLDYLDQNFQELSGMFDRMVALNELYKYTTQYGDRILDALENDEDCKKQHLAYKLEQVSSIMGENDYETHPQGATGGASTSGYQDQREHNDITNQPEAFAYEVAEPKRTAIHPAAPQQQESPYEIGNPPDVISQDDTTAAARRPQNQYQPNPIKPKIPRKGFNYGMQPQTTTSQV